MTTHGTIYTVLLAFSILAASMLIAENRASGVPDRRHHLPAQAEHVKADLRHAIALQHAAVQSLIEAGLGGDQRAMLLTDLTEAEYGRHVTRLDGPNARQMSPERLAFEREFALNVEAWRYLLMQAMSRARSLGIDGDLEAQNTVVRSLRNIAEANAQDGQVLIGITVSKSFLKELDAAEAMWKQFDR